MARSLGQFIAISKGDVADMRRLDMAPSRCTCRPFAGARSRGADPTSPGSQGVWWFAQVAVVSRMTTTRNALLTVPTPTEGAAQVVSARVQWPAAHGADDSQAAARSRCSSRPRNSAIAPGPDRAVPVRPARASASGL